MSNKISQKECVYQAVISYLEEQGQPIGNGEAIKLSKDAKKTVIQMVIDAADVMHISEEATVKFTDPKVFHKYVSGLVDNWLRKDTRLTGGMKYVTQSPGSRAGSSDEQLKALKALLATLPAGSEATTEIEAAIETRQAELKEAKQKAKPIKQININALPEEFRHLVQQ